MTPNSFLHEQRRTAGRGRKAPDRPAIGKGAGWVQAPPLAGGLAARTRRASGATDRGRTAEAAHAQAASRRMSRHNAIAQGREHSERPAGAEG